MDFNLEKVDIDYDCRGCGKHVKYLVMWPKSMERPTLELCDDCAKLNAERQNREEEIAILRMRIADADVPESFRTWKKELGNQKLVKQVLDAAGQNFYLCGKFGVGKTSCCCFALKRELAKLENLTAKFIFWPEFAEAVRGGTDTKRELMQLQRTISAADIVMIDDIGAGGGISVAVGTELIKIINDVYNSNRRRRIWLTSNLPLNLLMEKFEDTDTAERIIGRFRRMKADKFLTELTA